MRGVERLVGRQFVACQTAAPEPLAVEAHVPVRQVIGLRTSGGSYIPVRFLEMCIRDSLQTSIFAPLFKRKHISLDYGVMVAQQVLVLFVQVRILVVQRRCV